MRTMYSTITFIYIALGIASALKDSLPTCTSAICFDKTRCIDNNKVYVYEQENPRLDKEDIGSPYYGYLPRVPDVSNSIYTSDPARACLLAVYIWAEEYDYFQLPLLPYWNGGQNHIIVDFIARRFSQRGNISANIIGKAILAKSYMTKDYFRPYYDLPVPILKMSRTQANMQHIRANRMLYQSNKKYFLTFKGSTYKEGTAGSHRWKLLNIDQGDEDVVIHVQCFKMHEWHNKEEYKSICKRLDILYVQSDYVDLLNTTFALVPGGRQPASYRITEALSAGALPVFVYPETDWIKPYSHLINWDDFSLTFTPQQIPNILFILRSFSPERIEDMRRNARQVYNAHFNTPEQMQNNLFKYAQLQLLADSGTSGSVYSFPNVANITQYLLPTSIMLFVMYAVRRQAKYRVVAAVMLIVSMYSIIWYAFYGMSIRRYTTEDIINKIPSYTIAEHTLSKASNGEYIKIPSNMRKVTVVISNHARVENVKRIVHNIVQYKVVDEIIIWDDPIDEENAFNFNHTKVYIIRAQELRPMEKWGLLGRFKWALLGRNENILIQDDDQLLYESAIIKMLQIKNEDPDRLVCYFGREVVKNNEEITYITKRAPAPSHPPICLTKSLLTDRRFCLESIRSSIMVEDLASQGIPYWNGEDIWHSLVAIKMTGKLHTALPFNETEYKILPSPHAISEDSNFNHTLFRQMFTYEAANRLGLTADTLRLQQTQLFSQLLG